METESSLGNQQSDKKKRKLRSTNKNKNEGKNAETYLISLTLTLSSVLKSSPTTMSHIITRHIVIGNAEVTA